MAIVYNSVDGTLVIPSASAKYSVINTSASIATTGVLMLIGEAAKGPDFTLEDELQQNAFGPDQQADVIARYGSGNLIDAFRGAIVAVNDPNIAGSFNRVILVKTNPSTKAQANVTASDGSSVYGILADKSYGKDGNSIYFSVASKTAEVKPTTGAFTFLPPIASLNASFRANGGAAQALTISAGALPSAVQAQIDGLTSIDATGGVNRASINAITGNLALVATGFSVTITYDTPWFLTPSVGDTMYIPTGSAIQGGTNKNRGAYVVTASSAMTITATKLLDNTGSPGACTAPESVTSTAVVAVTDLRCFSPITVSLTGSVILDGLGKSLEINELTTGTDLLSNCCYALNTTKVTWVSKLSGVKLLTSAAEMAVNLVVKRQSDNASETLSGGGSVAIAMGYNGTTASVVINNTTLTTTVTGGTGTSLTLNLADYPTLKDLATYLNAQVGYSAAVINPALGTLSPVALDDVTATFGTTFGNNTGRLKADAYLLFKNISDNSQLVQLGVPAAQAAAGLPGVTTMSSFLTGGAAGGTTDAIVQSALEALESCQGNFVVPLFSRDASFDIADGKTASTSTYTIDAINAACKNHVLAMSTLKAKRRRQAFLSYRGTITADKTEAYGLNTGRCSLSFQDMKDLGLNGIVQFQPWYSAAKAAGAQAAADYRALTQKQINCSGVIQAAGDFKDNKDSQIEDALLAGLLVMQRNQSGGGFLWVSDQTTYSTDDNFVFNSIQAVYAADVIATTLEIRMQKAFVGQSIADVSAAQALSSIDTIMADLFRLKRIASSSDAPKGYKNAIVSVSGPIMKVSLEVKLAGEILFVPIIFSISQVTQTASQ